MIARQYRKSGTNPNAFGAALSDAEFRGIYLEMCKRAGTTPFNPHSIAYRAITLSMREAISRSNPKPE